MLERIFRRIYNRASIRTAIHVGMKVGKGTHFLGEHGFGSAPYLIEIGENVTISSNVSLINRDGSTAVIKKLCPINYANVLKFRRIIINDNRFIGSGRIIMPG